MNTLPESFRIKNDGSQRFKDTFIKYVNEKNDYRFSGTSKIYTVIENIVTSVNNPKYFKLPTLTLDEFIDLTSQDTFKVGEIVEVRNTNNGSWYKGKYIATLDRENNNYIVEVDGWSDVTWKEIRKVDPIKKYTIDQLKEIVGHDFEIIE